MRHLKKQTIDEVDLRHKRVLIRVDFNVPLDDAGQITDDSRIRAALPTINRAVDENAIVILCSHLGRPKGTFNQTLSLAPVAKRLQRLLNKPVEFVGDCIGPTVEAVVNKAQPGDVVLLENLRFHSEEEKNDDQFSAQLASLADVYINDAFGTAHRSHASTVGITKYVKVSAAGFLMKREVEALEGTVENPVRPFVAILGGGKVSGKIGVIENLGKVVDKVIIGGGMAFTFIKAMGLEIGQSLVENDMLDFAKRIHEQAMAQKIKFYLPVDCVVAASLDPEAETKIVPVQEIPVGWYGMDIGPASVRLFSEAVQNAKTILWNGPMGVFERDAFSRGTYSMAHAVANAYAKTIVGGGDTALAVYRAGESESMSFISTGGGAALQLLEGKHMPGLAALPDRL
ncbi:MAG: phosphoglycerate kinase [Nitrospirota bacterium]|nr:phosphoglycerate kinase [Nitrospirota bacterium]MDH5295843.1 phosphoglycerate kinase [Nitrospirota bacterium]MDH5575596.1 phosphoglycerate kinase [Nitrospirota bacterium]